MQRRPKNSRALFSRRTLKGTEITDQENTHTTLHLTLQSHTHTHKHTPLIPPILEPSHCPRTPLTYTIRDTTYTQNWLGAPLTHKRTQTQTQTHTHTHPHTHTHTHTPQPHT